MAKAATKQPEATLKVEAEKPATSAVVQPPTAATTVVTEVKPIPYNYAELLTAHKTKSAVIRFLSGEKYTRGQIAKFMGIKYQFVRNVLITPIKKAD